MGRAVEQALQPKVVFQPVVDLENGRVVGYEALSRLPGREGEGFLPLYQEARRLGALRTVLVAAQTSALRLGRTRPSGTYLFLNVHHWLVAPLLTELAMERDPGLVLELPETDPRPERWEALAGQLRAAEAALAIDDWGIGQADPLRLLTLAPEWVKLDRSLVARLGGDEAARRLVALIALWSRRHGIRLVAEGIECPALLQVVRRLGVPYGQGFALALPEEGWRLAVPLPALPFAGRAGQRAVENPELS